MLGMFKNYIVFKLFSRSDIYKKSVTIMNASPILTADSVISPWKQQVGPYLPKNASFSEPMNEGLLNWIESESTDVIAIFTGIL